VSSSPAPVPRGRVPEEVWAIAERLQRLADDVASASLVQSRPRDTRSVSSMTEVDGAELQSWESAGALLQEVELSASLLRGRIATARSACEAADQRRFAAASEENSLLNELDLRAALDAEMLAPKLAEEQARREYEAELLQRVDMFRVEMSDIERAEEIRHCSEKKEMDEVRHELTEAELSSSRSRAKIRELQGDAAAQRRSQEAGHAMKDLEEAESEADRLEEECDRLREDVGTLRFSLKDMKSFQHRRVQELNSQVQKLEKQRRKLETEQASKVRSEEASRASETESQLVHLQRLNEQLTVQVRDAQQDTAGRESAIASLQVEREELAEEFSRRLAEETKTAEELDELSAAEGLAKRECWQAQSRIGLLARQGEVMEDTARYTFAHLEEAEATWEREMKEEQSASRKTELLQWKLVVADTQSKRDPGGQGI